MVEMLYLVIGLMIVMAAVPVLAVFSLMLAIAKRFVMRFHDPVEKCRFRVRLGGNIAYFVGTLNAVAILYYFVTAGIPVGNAFGPWVEAAASRLPEGWYISTMFVFLIGGFLLKVTRAPAAAVILLGLFMAQVVMEMAPALFAVARDPGLFARFFEEIERMRAAYANVGGVPGTVMGTLIAGLVYGAVIQLSYYVLAIAGLVVALAGALQLRRVSAQKFRVPAE